MQAHIKDDHYERIAKVVSFIEENLLEKLTIEMIAEKASFSKYHFIRVFTEVTGETVGNYLRKRRISNSSKELLHSNRSILDIALDYQFESQEAYTRSFKRVYNTSPGRYRKLNNNQIAYGCARLTIDRLDHLKNRVTLQPKTVGITEKQLIGISSLTSLGKNTIPQLWSDFIPRINEIDHKANTDFYEVHPFDPSFKIESFTEDLEFVKWAAVEVKEANSIPHNMNRITLEGGKYAVFEHKGVLSTIQLSFDYAYGTWLSNSAYELDKRADFERYGDYFLGPEHPHSITELWIPIK